MKNSIIIIFLCGLSLVGCSKNRSKRASVAPPSSPPELPNTVSVGVNALEDVYSSNVAGFTLNGTCSEEGQAVIVKMNGLTPPIQPICSGNNWATKIDVTSLNKISGSISITIDHSKANGQKAPQVSASVTNYFVCPESYVGVPVLAGYTTRSFCVAKYEMKAGENNTVRSKASGSLKKTNHSRNAINHCQNVSSLVDLGEVIEGYDLITNNEWQTMARNIESVANNWGGGTIGSVQGLNRGLSNVNRYGKKVPSIDYQASENDEEGCKSVLILKGVQSHIYARDEKVPNNCGGQWHLQKRTHTLSNGEVIWDVAGSVWEWIKDSSRNNVNYGSDNYISGVTGMAKQSLSHTASQITKDLFGPKGDYLAVSEDYYGLGYATLGTARKSKGLYVARGGNLINTDFGEIAHAGIFAVHMDLRFDGNHGFRCTYHPPLQAPK